jgi:hypothetical protein
MTLVDHKGGFPLLDLLNSAPPTRDRGFGKFYDAKTTPNIEKVSCASPPPLSI